MTTNIYYIHDPMCSWCWAFRPALDTLNERLPNHLQLEYILGGLAKDTDEPMPEDLRYQIQNHWRTIQIHVPETKFNFEFWNKCHPRRSTYPACRAVLAAKMQDIKFEEPMIRAIQHAYYCQARNPSDIGTLIELADEINLDVKRFTEELNSERNRQLLNNEIAFARQIGGNAFPMLLLGNDNTYHQIIIDYTHPENMINEINRCLTRSDDGGDGSSTSSGE
jgi:putative protein-disulfide isomerase